MCGNCSIEKILAPVKWVKKHVFYAAVPKISSYILYLISLTVGTSVISLNIQITKQTFTYSKSAIQTFQKGVKYAQNLQQRHQIDIIDTVLVLLLLTLNIFYGA